MVSNQIEEKPIEKVEDLVEIYGYKNREEARAELPIVNSLLSLRDEIVDTFYDNMDRGRAYAIEAPWGKGKTSFVKMLRSEILASERVEESDLCWFFYDSLFYGNVTESITIFIDELFKSIEKTFAIKLRKPAELIARNLTPRLEINGLFTRLALQYEKNKNTEAILTDRIKTGLNNIPGKIIIVIDDIDRLTGEEALLLLRLTRVLKELPNTYILLPVAYSALVNLLKEQKIASPGGYVRKIFDRKVPLEFGLKEAKKFFISNLVAIGVRDELVSEELWKGYLWELSLYALRKHEVDQNNRITVNTGITDSNAWSLLRELDTPSGNFVREIFGQTRRDYNSSTNYVIKIQQPGSPNFRYLSYWQAANGATPSMLFEGTYSNGNDFPGFTAEKKNIFNLEVYSDEKLGNNNDSYGDIDPQRVSEIDGDKRIFWDLVKEIPESYFPPCMGFMISARMLKRLIDELKSFHSDKILNPGENNPYKLVKSVFAGFVADNAEVDV